MVLILFIITVTNLSFWVFIFTKLSLYPRNIIIDKNLKKKTKQCAILISVKNEEENIKNNFNSLLMQKPLGYELIVVDDYSSDNSLELLNSFSEKFDYLKIFKNKLNPGKKFAISSAINETDKEYIIFTDADCHVKSEQWAQRIISKFDDKIKIVLGYSPYFGNGFL